MAAIGVPARNRSVHVPAFRQLLLSVQNQNQNENGN